jgi:hypothetical protein
MASERPAWADNAKFYGSFGGTQKVGTCDREDVTWTVGNEVERRKKDNYLYVLPGNDETKFSWLDEATFENVERSVVVDGDTLRFLELGSSIKDSTAGGTRDLSFTFSGNYTKVDVSGTVSRNDDEVCQGDVTGTLTKGEEQDNARHFGTFDYTIDWFGPGDCPETGRLRVGNDYGRTCEEDYLYIPASGDRASFECADNGDSWLAIVTVGDDVIAWEETGDCEDAPSPCWTEDVTLHFDADYASGTVSGFVFESDPEACQGLLTGDFHRVEDDNGNGKKGKGGGGSDGPCFVGALTLGPNGR